MVPFRNDQALYVKRDSKHVIRFSGIYVDDVLRARTTAFRDIYSKINKQFEMESNKELPYTFTEFKTTQEEDGTLALHQRQYLSKLKVFLGGARFQNLPSERIKHAWFSHDQLDCSFEVTQLSKITNIIFQDD